MSICTVDKQPMHYVNLTEKGAGLDTSKVSMSLMRSTKL